jgi:hypothetical protein
MPGADEYLCRTCSKEFLIIAKALWMLPVPLEVLKGPGPSATEQERAQRKQIFEEWQNRHLQTFICNECEFMLFLPKEIDQAPWENWQQADSKHKRYPFLLKLARKIDEALKEKSPCSIDFGQITCPYCSRTLLFEEELSPKCERCGSSNVELTGSGMASMGGSFPNPWPPIA